MVQGSALYITPLICIFEYRAQALNLNTFILLFVNDGLLISQGKMYNKTLPELYFSRVYNDSNPELDKKLLFL